MANSAGKAGQQPIYGAAVPLAKPIKLDTEKLAQELRSLVAMAGARVKILDGGSGKGGILSGLRSRPTELNCEIAGVRLTISAVPRPLCSASVIHSFVNPAIWRGALSGMTEHRAHLLVAESDDSRGGGSSDAMFDRATAVTLATAAIANMCSNEAQGVIWLPARNAIPIRTFGMEMERFIDGQAPLQFWLRWQVLPAPVQAEMELGELSGDALQPGISTIGLTAFIGSEIIAPPSNCDRDVMLDHIFALASAVIDENAQLKDGAVYGKAGGIMVRLSQRKNGPYSERPFWELLPRPAPAAKGRPLFNVSGVEDNSDDGPAQNTSDKIVDRIDGSADEPQPERHLRLVVRGN